MNVFVLLNTKEDILKNEGNRAVLGHHWLPSYFFFYYGSQWCPKTAWLQTFFRISSFVFSRTNTFIQVWNYLRLSKWHNFHFWVHYPFKYGTIPYYMERLATLYNRGLQPCSWGPNILKSLATTLIKHTWSGQSSSPRLLENCRQVCWSRLEINFPGEWVPRSRVEDLCYIKCKRELTRGPPSVRGPGLQPMLPIRITWPWL